jgi:hypothetical protein
MNDFVIVDNYSSEKELKKINDYLDIMIKNQLQLEKTMIESNKLLLDKLTILQNKLDVQESKINKIIASNKAIAEWYNNISDLDERNTNFYIRSFMAKKAPPVPFVAQKTNEHKYV